MKLSCAHWCHIQEMLANLKCPNCFSTKVKLCEEESEENALCTECDFVDLSSILNWQESGIRSSFMPEPSLGRERKRNLL